MATITVTTPRERSFVVVNDPVPAGCELVDPKIAVANKQVVRKVEAVNAKNTLSTWWGTWNHIEYRDQRCLLFADYLTPGTHTFVYALHPIVAGTFTTPAPAVEEMYNPEIFGRGEECLVRIE